MPEFDKKLYWERRERGLTGTIGYVKAHAVVKDDEGNEHRIPLDYKATPKGTQGMRERSRSRMIDRKYTKKGFKGHVPGTHEIPATYTPDLTNHVRHQMQRANRESMKQRLAEAVERLKVKQVN
jgi:hypothetical protein